MCSRYISIVRRVSGCKFNFLNTDASVGLTVDSSKDGILADAAQLLLGGQTSRFKSIVERVIKQITVSQREINKDIDNNKRRIDDARGSIDVMEGAPALSDQLFADVILALKRLNWIRDLGDKSSLGNITVDLNTAGINLAVIEKSMLGSSRIGASALD